MSKKKILNRNQEKALSALKKKKCGWVVPAQFHQIPWQSFDYLYRNGLCERQLNQWPEFNNYQYRVNEKIM